MARQQLSENTALPANLGIEFTDSRKIIGWGLMLIASLFIGAFVWMALAEITGTVVASGTVKIASERQVVQHLEGGIVREILVKNGDTVEKNQPLLVMESAGVTASLQMLRSRQYGLRLSEARLQAEKSHADHIVWPPDLLTATGKGQNADIDLLLDSELKIFNAHRKALADGIALFENQIEQITEVIDSLRERIHYKNEVLASLNEEISAKSELYSERFLDKSVLLDLQRNLSQVDSAKEQLSGSINGNTSKIAELKLRIISINTEYTKKAATDLGLVQQQILEIKERLRPLFDAQKRLEVRAPVGGEVMALAVHSTGEVLAPGQAILEIVPENEPLIIECRILTDDITKISQGLSADVQLAAFDTRTNPKIRGQVTYISADREEEKTAYGILSFYIVHVVLERRALERSGLYISPGMPVAVFINTEPRTVLSSALAPLRQGLDRALRED